MDPQVSDRSRQVSFYRFFPTALSLRRSLGSNASHDSHNPAVSRSPDRLRISLWSRRLFSRKEQSLVALRLHLLRLGAGRTPGRSAQRQAWPQVRRVLEVAAALGFRSGQPVEDEPGAHRVDDPKISATASYWSRSGCRAPLLRKVGLFRVRPPQGRHPVDLESSQHPHFRIGDPGHSHR